MNMEIYNVHTKMHKWTRYLDNYFSGKNYSLSNLNPNIQQQAMLNFLRIETSQWLENYLKKEIFYFSFTNITREIANIESSTRATHCSWYNHCSSNFKTWNVIFKRQTTIEQEGKSKRTNS